MKYSNHWKYGEVKYSVSLLCVYMIIYAKVKIIIYKEYYSDKLSLRLY